MSTTYEQIFKPIQKITFVITFFLLFLLMFSGPLAEWIWNVKAEDYSMIPLWYKIFSLLLEFILVFTVIWLNGDNLSKLNIDKPLIVIFIFTGVIISLYYLINFRAIIFFMTFMVFWRLKQNNFKFKSVNVDYSRILLIFIAGLAPVILTYFLRPFFDAGWVAHQPTWNDLYYANLPAVLFEEITFRGLLWMCLKYLKVNDNKAFYIQTLLFWVLHIKYWFIPATFWLWLPLGSLWLSLLVLRTKSLTLSTVGHFIYNFIIILIT